MLWTTMLSAVSEVEFDEVYPCSAEERKFSFS